MNKTLILAGLFLSGCASTINSPKEEAVKLVGTTWIIESLFGQPTESQIFLKLSEDGQLTGFAGCNRFFANYVLDQDKMEFGLVGSTKMMCPDMETETQLFKVIDQTRYHKLVDNKLLLLNESKKTVAKGFAQTGNE